MKIAELKEKALSLLEPIILDASEMVLKPKAKKPADSMFRSHFNGSPYFEPGEAWPAVSPKKPYDFVFQVVNDGTVPFPRNVALIQFYYNWEMSPWSNRERGWLVKTYKKIDRKKGVTVDSPEEAEEHRKYCEITFKTIRLLPDWESIDRFVPRMSALCEKIDDDEPWTAYRKLCKSLKTKDDPGSFFGGYPQWIQEDESRKRKLLCQIDSEYKAGISWGDEGRIFLLYDPKNPEKIDFLLQSY